MFLRLALGLIFFSFSGTVWAACDKPDGVGVEGEIIYNSAWKTMQFCNGTEWRSMDAGLAGGGSTPTGAVLAFDLATCPTGWSEYTPARGRFLRGIDSAGTVDPSGKRAPGNIQSHMFKQHGHTNYYASSGYNGYGNQGSGWLSNFATAPGGAYAGSVTTQEFITNSLDPSAGVETRPVNVAVLYCRKN